jgi:two-component system sensor histidine kinase CreC
MSLSARIFIVYLLFVTLCGYFVLRTVMDEIRPGVRQSTEETLVDTANLLAEFLREPLLENQLQSPRIRDILQAYGRRQPNATIWGVNKQHVNHRIYVTDGKGTVLLDSSDIAVGQDYSRWNDVYLTLQGKYGARSTLETRGDESSSVMYVAAPITHEGNIIGVVSVAKPNRSVQPYIDRTQRRLGLLGAALILLGLISGAAFSWWLSRELRRLREYALNVSQGQRAVLKPGFISSGELGQLAQALESMRIQLDGKAYIEQYVQTLTHELKSPLAGIRAASELLQTPMSDEQRQKFLANIDSESLRLQQLIERLLNLALVEQQQSLHSPQKVPLKPLIESLLDTRAAPVSRKHIELQLSLDENAEIFGERFLIEQAILNLLDNALDFALDGSLIQLETRATDKNWMISVTNQGEAIPDYAKARLTERFFSLPRPSTGRKSTGLGLSFVQEVMNLHHGELRLDNTEDGVRATLYFPR